MSPLINADDLRQIFKQMDKNGDGVVSLDELHWLLERIAVEFGSEELQSLVGKSSLNFNEFLSFYESISVQCNYNEIEVEEKIEEDQEESDLVKAFKVFDMNNDGFISSEELESVLARLGLWDERSGKDCRGMIRVYDTNLDGKLDFQEFKNMMLLTIS